jgi:hypothetical protein
MLFYLFFSLRGFKTAFVACFTIAKKDLFFTSQYCLTIHLHVISKIIQKLHIFLISDYIYFFNPFERFNIRVFCGLESKVNFIINVLLSSFFIRFNCKIKAINSS